MNNRFTTLLSERWRKILILAAFLVVCTTNNALSQTTKQVSGYVKDKSGEALPGVSIAIRNTSNGTASGIDGSFTIQVADNSFLVFSYIGYETQTVSVEGKNVLDITLLEAPLQIGEVVAIGYGAQRKATLTGAVSSIGTKELTVSTVANTKDLLAGKLPGVRVQQQTGEPGNYSSKMDIRGLGSPLIVIDGVIRDEAAFQRLEPNEIESVSVLKDASAAVYGMRAANGTVIVTTKRGNEGKTKIEYSGTIGFQNPSGLPDVLNAWQYATLVREADKNMGRGINATFTVQDVERFRQEGGTDWQDLVMRNFPVQTHHNLTANGGTEKINYFLSLGYYSEDGVWKSGDLNYDRYNIRSNLGFEIAKGLQADLLLSGTFDNKNQPYKDTWEQFKSLWMLRPTDAAYANNNANYLSDAMYGLNPLATTNSDISGYKKVYNKIFNGTLSLTYDIPFLKGLQAKALYSYDYKTAQNKNFQKTYTLYEYDSDVYKSFMYNSPSSMYRKTWEGNQSMFQASLNYATSINREHNIKVLALYEQSSSTQDNFYGSSYFDMDAVDELYAGLKNDQEISSDMGQIWEQKNAGIIGRINYDYRSKYLLEFSFRYDGSSKFAPGHRWGFFPAISGGYRISEESLIKKNKSLSFITNLKLRASYGSMGDDSSSSYQYLTGYEYPNTGSSYIFGGSAYSGLTFKALANESLTWYKSKTFNIGTDLDLWNGLLSAQIDFFWRYRDGLFASRSGQIPGTFGAEFPQENLNKDMHKGFEIVLTHRNRINDFEYSISGNFAVTRSKWRDRIEGEYKNSYDRWRNSYIGRYNDMGWAYGSNGQFSSMEDIWNYAVQDGLGGSTQLPGDWKYEDWNGDGIIDDNDFYPNTYEHEGDRGNPKMTYGSTITAAWKGFDMNVLFQGGAGFNVIYFEQLQYPLCFGGNGLAYFFDRYHQDENGNWIAGRWPTTRDPGSFSTNYARAKQTTYNASYLRIKSAELGYTIPGKITGNWGIERIRLSLSGYNLITFSNLDFVDPEHPEGGYGYLYPIMRNFNFGVNITF
ncbi:MAG: TonB-dependent receptor [Dysgonamonadaceae bacterium]|jgi:TonB-linked SusC/RagA family outer membrane protein|nr:TonB-dependent receptor [Dysgonamonadaceae bacterium]